MKKVRVQALTTPETAKQVKELAIKEKRSVGNIAAILIEDGLKLVKESQMMFMGVPVNEIIKGHDLYEDYKQYMKDYPFGNVIQS